MMQQPDDYYWIDEFEDEEAQEKKKQLILKTLNLSNNTINMLYQFLREIRQCFPISKSKSNMNNVIELINDSLLKIKSTKTSLIKIVTQQENDFGTDDFLQILQKLDDQIRQELKQWCQEEKENNNVEQLIQLVNEISEINEEIQSFDCELQYKQLIRSFTNEEQCFSFACNKILTILYVGLECGKIKAYGFNSYNKLIKTIAKHEAFVCKLIWMENSQQLVSASGDSLIIIWNKEWQPYHTLLDHSDSILSMLINQKEDLIITGSVDETIKFWRVVNTSWTCQQTIDTEFEVLGLSLNPQENQLISCGYNSNINLITLQENQQWSITQIIRVDISGYHLSFLNDYQFAFQPFAAGFLEIFKYEPESQSYIITQFIHIQNSYDKNNTFPCNFIRKANMMTVKHCQNVYFYHLDSKEVFQMQKSIEFENDWLYGSLTADGQYLITQELKSRKIQVRKFRKRD